MATPIICVEQSTYWWRSRDASISLKCILTRNINNLGNSRYRNDEMVLVTK